MHTKSKNYQSTNKLVYQTKWKLEQLSNHSNLIKDHLRTLKSDIRQTGLDIGTGPMRVLKLSGQLGPPVFLFYGPVVSIPY